MKIKLDRYEDFLIVNIIEHPKKQLDLTNIKTIKKEILKNIPKDEKYIILNLKNISYIDSSIIGFFVDLFNHYRNIKGSFGLMQVNDRVYKILELVNLTKFVPIYHSTDDLKK